SNRSSVDFSIRKQIAPPLLVFNTRGPPLAIDVARIGHHQLPAVHANFAEEHDIDLHLLVRARYIVGSFIELIRFAFYREHEPEAPCPSEVLLESVFLLLEIFDSLCILVFVGGETYYL